MSWLHIHYFREVKFEATGYATLGLSFLAEREYGHLERCRCGKERNRGGQYLFGDRALNPSLYSAEHWPMTASGERLPIRRPFTKGEK